MTAGGLNDILRVVSGSAGSAVGDDPSALLISGRAYQE